MRGEASKTGRKPRNAGEDRQASRGPGKKTLRLGGLKGSKPKKATNRGGAGRPKPRKPRPAPRELSVAAKRRILIVLMILALLVAVAIGGIYIYQNVAKAWKVRSETKPQFGIGTAPQIVDCTSEQIELDFVDAPTTATPGEPWSTTVRMTNTSKDLCLVDGSAATLEYVVTSGDETMSSSVGCSADAEKKPLLLGPGETWETSLTWPTTRSADCGEGEKAPEGTYVVHLHFGGKETKTNAIVDVK